MRAFKVTATWITGTHVDLKETKEESVSRTVTVYNQEELSNLLQSWFGEFGVKGSDPVITIITKRN